MRQSIISFDPRIKPSLGCQLNQEHPLARGLVGCWLMNEGAGNKVYDATGNGGIGTITGPVWGAGQSGSCLNFDGSGDYVTFNKRAWNFSTGWSISFWVNHSSAPSGDYDADAIADEYVDASNSWTLTLRRDSVDPPYWRIALRLGGTEKMAGSKTTSIFPGIGGWHLITSTFDGANLMIYVDGVWKATTAAAISTSTLMGIRLFGNTVSIGLIGSIGSGFLWNRGLPAPEIAQLYRDPYAMFRRERIEFGCVMSPSIGVTITPGSLGTSLTLQSPGVYHDYEVLPAVLALLLAQQTPIVNYDFKVSPDALALLLGLQTPTLLYDSQFSASTLALLLAQQTPDFRYDFKLALGAALSLVLAQQTPDVNTTVNVTLSPGSQDLVLSLQSATVNYGFTFSADALALLVANLASDVNHDYQLALGSALALATELQAPTTGIGVTVDVQGLVLGLQTPTLTYDMLVSIAASLGLTLTLQTPAVTLPAGRTYITCPSSDPLALEFYVNGTLVAKFTAAGVQVLGGTISSL